MSARVIPATAATPAEAKANYRRIRTGWGFALAAIWLFYRWLSLGAQHKAAVAAITHCDGMLEGAGCAVSRSTADAGFAGGMVVAVICAPLAWMVAHYIARWRIDSTDHAATKLRAELDADHRVAQQRDSAARLAQVAADAERAHQSVERSDFIHKLGAVSDFLNLLATETDPTRLATIRLGAAQALRDLTAKHTIDQLAAVVRADDAVKVTLAATLRRLRDSSFEDAAEVHVLTTALRQATVVAA